MDFQSQFDNAINQYASKNQFGVSMIPAHTHSGSDSIQVDYMDLTNKTHSILYRILSPTTATSVATTVGGDFVIPFSGYVTSVGATVDTAGTTNSTTIDIKKNASSIMNTKITINSGSKTSRTATVQPILNSSVSFKEGDIFTFNVDAISTTPANGLTIFINVVQTQ